MHGTDSAYGVEPGAPVVHRRIVGQKSAALEAAQAAGLGVLVGRFSVAKYHQEVAPENLYEVVECEPNLFLTTGIETKLWPLVCAAGSPTAFNAANARLCVGDSATAAAVGQTDLQATTNKLRKAVTGSPVISGRQVTFSAQFTTGEANWAWLEVGVANDASGALLSRSALTSPGLGTKVNTAVWVLNWTLGISATAG